MNGFQRIVHLALVLGATAIPSAVSAQWRVEAQAGQLQYEVAPDMTSTTLGAGLLHATPTTLYGVSVGVPLSREEPLWGALFGSRRLASTGSLRFGIDVAGSAFGYRIEPADGSSLPNLPGGNAEPFTGWGVSAEAMPLVAWSGSRAGLEGRAGAVHFTSGSDGAAGFDRTSFVSDLAASVTPVTGVQLRADASWIVADGEDWRYVGAGLTWSPSVTLWGSIGGWLDSLGDAIQWQAGLSVPLGDRLALRAHASHDAFDPVYATPGRTSWGIGASLLLGEPAGLPEPIPAAYEDGIATVALDADDVGGRPSIAGDFNGWEPQPMTRQGGRWIHRVAVEPGVYNYAFVDEDGDWFVPEDTPGRRDDGMGGWVAVLVVSE